MLVLTRRKNQQIIIDGDVRIKVLKIKGNTVSLGISAPPHVQVLRAEVKRADIGNSAQDDLRNLAIVSQLEMV